MISKGKKAFNRCDVKVVEFVDFIFPSNVKSDNVLAGSEYTTLRDGSISERAIVKDTASQQGYDAGHLAILHCPRTEDDRVNIQSDSDNHTLRTGALASLRELAGSLICEHCRYSKMSPVDITLERAEIARVDAQRLEAIKLRAEALHELTQIDPNFREIGLSES